MAMTAFLGAPYVIQVHAVAAMGAAATGAVQFLTRKGTPYHRITGWLFVLLMLTVAISSFFIHTICQLGGFSLIHLLSVLTLITLPYAVISARRGQIARHRRTMTLLYLFALLGAGIFTLLPGRLMHDMIFGTGLAAHTCESTAG